MSIYFHLKCYGIPMTLIAKIKNRKKFYTLDLIFRFKSI